MVFGLEAVCKGEAEEGTPAGVAQSWQILSQVVEVSSLDQQQEEAEWGPETYGGRENMILVKCTGPEVASQVLYLHLMQTCWLCAVKLKFGGKYP